jgi:two-component system response regulator FixJ
MDLTTFVVDDDEAAGQSLTFLLRTSSIRARAFPSATAFLEQLHPDHRGCVVTDVRMPVMDGIALVERLRELACPMPVIVITGHADVQLAVNAMKAGAAEFIEKPYQIDEMLTAVRRCLDTAQDHDERKTEKDTIGQRIESLTERESQVFAAVAEGRSNKEVALALQISPRTVEIHRANVMAKMQAASLSDLVRMMLTARAA